MSQHVVVQLGRYFQTARIQQLATQSVQLAGSWAEPQDDGRLLVIVGEQEVWARILEKGPGYLRLIPAGRKEWAPLAQRAWMDALRNPTRASPQATCRPDSPVGSA